MAIETLWAGFVVIRRHHQHRIGSGIVGETREFHRLMGGIGASAGNDRDPAASGLNGGSDDRNMLLVRDCR